MYLELLPLGFDVVIISLHGLIARQLINANGYFRHSRHRNSPKESSIESSKPLLPNFRYSNVKQLKKSGHPPPQLVLRSRTNQDRQLKSTAGLGSSKSRNSYDWHLKTRLTFRNL